LLKLVTDHAIKNSSPSPARVRPGTSYKQSLPSKREREYKESSSLLPLPSKRTTPKALKLTIKEIMTARRRSD
jgi:hypothetical protein